MRRGDPRESLALLPVARAVLALQLPLGHLVNQLLKFRLGEIRAYSSQALGDVIAHFRLPRGGGLKSLRRSLGTEEVIYPHNCLAIG